jgi:SAM-dependent methyltransferase
MRTVPKQSDAFGHALARHRDGVPQYEVVERDDGFITASISSAFYFGRFRQWPSHERAAMRFAKGPRALDVGCGAGRVALHLQSRGFRVTAIDNSPLAVTICRHRGVRDARVLSFDAIGRFSDRRFDSVVMYGNNFGLFGSVARARRLLGELHRITSKGAVILAETINPYKTDHPAHLRYRRRNRRRGRMAGQIRIRIRFEQFTGPWIDYLLVSPDEMRNILKGTGWHMARCLEDEAPSYVAVVRKG